LKPKIKLRGSTNNLNNEVGRASEKAAADYFVARGFFVEDVAGQNIQYDLLVETFGRVQVKTCYKTKAHKAKFSYLFRATLGNATSRYASDSIDWFAFVYWLNKRAKVWLVESSKLQVNDSYLACKYEKSCTTVANLWEDVEPAPTLLEDS
jgi:hypothetical protein